MTLLFSVIFSTSLFLFGLVSCSENDHTPNFPTTMEKTDVEPDGERHDHKAREMEDHNEADDHEGHDHGDETETIDDGHAHEEDDQGDDALRLTEEQKKEIDLDVEQAGPGSLQNELALMGEIRLNEDRLTHVVPKVSGVARTVEASLGDKVHVGQVLASLESAELAEARADYLVKLRHLDITRKAYERKKYLREEKITSEAGWLEKEAEYLNAETALKTAEGRLAVSGLTEEEIQNLPNVTGAQFGQYNLRAPMSGTVIEKHLVMGEMLSVDSGVFTIADLSLLWVDLRIPAHDMDRVRQENEIVIQSSNGSEALGIITLIGPVVDRDTRTAFARIILDNTDGRWKPGTFVTGYLRLSAKDLPVVVPLEAVQNMDGEDIVFVQEGNAFDALPVVVGRKDRKRVEIISGLDPGAFYVARGAFELKAIMVTSSLDPHAGHGH